MFIDHKHFKKTSVCSKMLVEWQNKTKQNTMQRHACQWTMSNEIVWLLWVNGVVMSSAMMNDAS